MILILYSSLYRPKIQTFRGFQQLKYINTNAHNFMIALRITKETLSGLKIYNIASEIKVIKMHKKVKQEYIADVI